MARDPLRIVSSLRRRAVEQARYALGACLATEAEAAQKIRSLDDAACRDRETSEAWQDAHHFLEMSAVRSESAREERQIIEQALATAAMRSEQARGVVAAARTAAEAVEQLIRERKIADQMETATREQHVLDDIARLRPRDSSTAGGS